MTTNRDSSLLGRFARFATRAVVSLVSGTIMAATVIVQGEGGSYGGGNYIWSCVKLLFVQAYQLGEWIAKMAADCGRLDPSHGKTYWGYIVFYTFLFWLIIFSTLCWFILRATRHKLWRYWPKYWQ